MTAKISPFEFAKTIHETKQDLMGENPETERDYNAFMVNRCLSYYGDTILFANMMNTRHGLPAKLQYDYLRGSISKRRRYSKWHKQDPDEAKKLAAVMKMFDMSRRKAIEAVRVIPADLLDSLVIAYEAAPGGQPSKPVPPKDR